MHREDGCLKKGLLFRIILLLFILLIPFALSGITTSESINNKDVSFEEETTAYTNSVLIPGYFKYFNVALNVEVEKICIIAYYGNSIPGFEERNVNNYYKWEYDNGIWIDSSGHDYKYIKPSQCKKENNIYSFFVSIDKSVIKGQWTIKIYVDDEEIEESKSSIDIISHFNFFILSLIGVYEPNFRVKKTIEDTEYICSERKRIMVEQKEDIDNLVDNVLKNHATFNKDETNEKTESIFIFDNSKPLTKEFEKSTVSTYPKSKLKNKISKNTNSLIFKNNGGGKKVFCSIKSRSHSRFIAIILTFFLVSILFIPIIAPQNPSSTPVPIITSFNIFPESIDINGSILLNVTACDPLGISSITADIVGLETINLSFNKGAEINDTIYSGLWQGNWLANNVDPGKYTLLVTVQNMVNISSFQKRIFTVLSDSCLNDLKNESIGDQMEETNNTIQTENQTDDTSTNNDSEQNETQNSSNSNDTNQIKIPTEDTDNENTGRC